MLVLAVGGVLIVVRDDNAAPAAAAAELVVPSVRGEQLAQATRDLEAAGFRVVRRSADGPTPRGEVLRQSPAPGSYTGKDPATVVLRVSSGRVELDSDDLLGTTYARAARTVEQLGLRPVRVERSAATGIGTVVAVDPEGRVPVGARVSLTVAVAAAVTPTTAGSSSTTKPQASGKPKHGKSKAHGKPGKKKH